MSSRQRRSGRISRQVSILLLGTDTYGRVFSEETITLVLSRYGAGILSRYRLAPDETLTVRLDGSDKEAEVRLVGHIGQRDGAFVYGIAFRHPEVDFWKVEFPQEPTVTVPDLAFECEICRTRQVIEQRDIEADVYAVNDSILHHCEECGCSTSWRRAAPEAVASVPAVPASPAQAVAEAARDLPEPVLITTGTAVAATAFEPIKAGSNSTIGQSAGRRENRRAHVRTKVTFTACLRYASSDEIVECDNVSKGGLCFRSRRHYPANESIEIAAPYSVGEQAIFVSAVIRRAEELPSGLFRYGVEYAKSSRDSTYF